MWLYERPLAHRGLRSERGVVENSMTAFKKAIEKGYNVETDVHLLKSGEAVLFHDETLKRVCGKNVRVGDLTIDDVRGENYLLPSGEHIPLLAELLDAVDGKTSGILLEMKFQRTRRKLEKAIIELIKGKENYIAINAFDPFSMKWFKDNAPEFTRGYVSCAGLFPISRLKIEAVDPDFLSFNIGGINGHIKNYVKKHDLGLIAWTINTPEKLARAIKLGVNNFITEKIDLDELNFSVDRLPRR